jgi:hypothetical protein
MGITSTCCQAFVTDFHIKVLRAYAGTKNKTKIKMGTPGFKNVTQMEGHGKKLRSMSYGKTWMG